MLNPRRIIAVPVALLLLNLLLACSSSTPPAAKLTPKPKLPPATPAKVAMPLDPALRTAALNEISSALHSNDAVRRAHAVEALQIGLGADAKNDIIQALNDDKVVVRFAAAMACGTLRLGDAMPILQRLRTDPDRNVEVAVRYALHRLGDRRFSHDLEIFSRDMDPSVRANTVVVFGLLGEKSALKILRHMQRDRSPAVRLQVPEAMWRLGDSMGMEALVSGTISSYPDDQIIAFLGLAGPRDRRVIGHIRGGLTAEYLEVALAAARAMGQLGSDEGYGVALKGAKSPDPRQRILAAVAFGAIGRSDAQPILSQLLKDPDAEVRLAAASAILQVKP